MPKKKIKATKLTVKLPFNLGELEFEPDEVQQRAAWNLYVELSTRIAVQPLGLDGGLLGEALSSLHDLFATTREVLKEAGPDVGASSDSVGGIAIAVLNRGLRPFLAKWHPRLLAWETERSTGVSMKEHEVKWAEGPQLRAELEALRNDLALYAHALASIAGVKE
jgi:hypothetical protein